ncbi:MAG: tRNA (5-methylaminomethyl-2-thiouridine)(34)-methyltransferase MnmD [Spirosomaceae bacterium]|jgi:tRNA U34 5-methylaminomethyl-2-thiouridine-forming methyltransferase MnmC|nr:tRNA (5-methylaminomethyl-2-thiouridine)(34)-methyltransferase MnmD [Spirosomataceae bacterium]
MNDLEPIITRDGSHTLFSKKFNQIYHSTFGAIQESRRVFVELGLEYATEHFNEIKIFEMGFGTGLNALMTAQIAQKRHIKIDYTTVEAYPIAIEIAQNLNYDGLINSNDLLKLHQQDWNTKETINQYFTLQKIKGELEKTIFDTNDFNLVYYDAFAPETQPELWTQEIFEKVASMMRSEGILTTYCSKGYVQRNLKAAGFRVEKHAGPVGKREVIRAIL